MNTTRSPLVSVITPVHNGQAYLAECIESVLAQSYHHWEYIIVNNCSTDQSDAIAQHYARLDARIRILHNHQLLNAVDNWNHALRQLAPDSQFCKVVHADDWLFPDCLKQMVALAQAHPTVGIVSAYRLDEARVNLDGLPYAETVVMGREICRRSLLRDEDYFGSPSSLLIRSEIVRARDPFYTSRSSDTDSAACFEILRDWDFGFVHQVLTYTRRHSESRSAAMLGFEGRRLDKLRRLQTYGRLYLNDDEYRRRWQVMLENYYRLLAWNLFELQDGAFWKAQAEALRGLGQPLSRPRLARAAALELLDARQSWRHLRQGLARRRGRVGPPAPAAPRWPKTSHPAQTGENG